MYPYKNFRFKVESKGTIIAGFSDVTGFDASYEVVEYREGNFPDITATKQPGIAKYSNITFKKGVIDAIDLFQWVEDIKSGDPAKYRRENITITLLKDGAGETAAAQWVLKNAWPCKYTGPELKASASEIAVESVEFAHEGLTRVKI